MTMRADCSAAETLAGAIAIGEASDAERDAYRVHLATCGSCLEEFGGEREIERVMALAVQARDDERWEPDVRKALARHAPRRGWGWAAAAAAVLVAAVGAFSLQRNAPSAGPSHMIAAHESHALAALNTQSAPRREGQAESLVVGSAAAVTTSFTLNFDERGNPLRCTITKSSGDDSLDRAVCRTALRVRYSPRGTTGR